MLISDPEGQLPPEGYEEVNGCVQVTEKEYIDCVNICVEREGVHGSE